MEGQVLIRGREVRRLTTGTSTLYKLFIVCSFVLCVSGTWGKYLLPTTLFGNSKPYFLLLLIILVRFPFLVNKYLWYTCITAEE